MVIHHYQNCVENGNLPVLKQVLNTLMTMNYIEDLNLAISYSRILEAVDMGHIAELPPVELTLFDKFLARTPHTTT